MLTVAVLMIGILSGAVVLPLVLMRRLLPAILIADELDEFRQEVRASRSARSRDEDAPVFPRGICGMRNYHGHPPSLEGPARPGSQK
jgi:hypothetical protein